MIAAPVEVLVIGAGPSGLFAAVELARRGVQARVVERELEPHHQARATAIQPGTLEILARAGLLDEVLAASVHLPFARVFDADLGLVSEIAFAGAGSRWEFQCSLPQWRTEQILADRLSEFGVAVERGVEATQLEARDDGFIVELKRSDGALETVEVGWIVGAGGAHSVTRESMTERLIGETYPGTALVADVRVRCCLPRDCSALVAAPEGYVLLAALPDERWITFVGDLHSDEVRQLASDTSTAAVETAMRRRITGDICLEDIAWAASFQMHRRLASRLAGKRRFLLGDAGHLSSPFGGEGLNSGLHDGHNLGWKLALVLGGRGRPCLLESFAAERMTADRHVLDVSDRLHAAAHAAVEASRTGVRPPPLAPDAVRALVRSRSMLDVSYAGSPIVGGYATPGRTHAAELAPGDRYPNPVECSLSHQLLLFDDADEETLARLRSRWHGLVDIIRADHSSLRAGLVLIRPDGYIGFRSSTATTAALTAVDTHLQSYLIVN